jgi:hypothetical protein
MEDRDTLESSRQSLNPTRLTIADAVRALRAAGAREVTVESMRSDVDAGAPTNADGTINLVHCAAWLKAPCDGDLGKAAWIHARGPERMFLHLAGIEVLGQRRRATLSPFRRPGQPQLAYGNSVTAQVRLLPPSQSIRRQILDIEAKHRGWRPLGRPPHAGPRVRRSEDLAITD